MAKPSPKAECVTEAARAIGSSLLTNVINPVFQSVGIKSVECLENFWDLEKNRNLLSSEMASLNATTKALNSVIAATVKKSGELEERSEEVDKWCIRYAELKGEFEKFIKDLDEGVGCLGRCAWRCCCCACIKLSNMRHAIKILEGDRKKIKELTTKVRPIAVNKEFNLPVLKGVETLMTKLLKYVDDDAVHAVVIHGQRGVGKTTLLKSLNNRLREKGNRDMMIYIDLSDNPPPSDIKEAIRNDTDLQLPLNPFSPRLVFLLNDAGENTDFKEIGIPYLNHRCKVILTMPSAKALARIRNNYRCEGLLVPCLEESFALELFNHITSDPTRSTEEQKIVKEIVNHCEGLPLALTTVGEAMVAMYNWAEVSQKLKRSWWNLSTLKPHPSTGEGMMFESLSRDFKLLDDLRKKKAFLYCSLFPKGHRIDKFELVNYWIAEGILKDSDKIYGSDIINDLISKSLLQSCNEYSVRMHSVMHGLALWIASISEEEWAMKLYVEAGVNQCTTPNATEWGKYEWMSLMKNDISILPTNEMPDCTRLRTLLLQHNQRLLNLPVGFCNSMTSLRVLDLSHTGINVIPEDLSKMVKLQLLNLSYTNIINLSGDQLEKLVELKILNLECTPRLDNIPFQVISSLPEMIVLNIYGSKYRSWKMQEVEVLKKLNKLRDLGITINDEKVLHWFSIHLPEKIRYLRMENCHDLTELGAANFRYMTNLQELSICSCYDLVTLNSKMVDIINFYGFNDLEETEINIDRFSSKIKVLLLVKLDKLVVNRMPHVWFENLLKLKIESCGLIVNIDWVLKLHLLREMTIENCVKLEQVIRAQSDVGYKPLERFLDLELIILKKLPELKSIYPGTLKLPKLVSITVQECPNLNRLPLASEIQTLKKISGSQQWWQKLVWKRNIKARFEKKFDPL